MSAQRKLEQKNEGADKKVEKGENSAAETRLQADSQDSQLGVRRSAQSQENSEALAKLGRVGNLTLVGKQEPELEKAQALMTTTRPDSKLGFGPLQINAEQFNRAIDKFDPVIWESHNKTTTKDQVDALREIQKGVDRGSPSDPFLKSLSKNETPSQASSAEFSKKLPPDLMKKIDSWLIGESANEIMKQAQLKGQESRFTKESDRLLKESILAIRVGHLPDSAEYQSASANLDTTVKDIRKQYQQPQDWTAADHKKIAESLKEQESKSEHWSREFSQATKNGRLGCASYITNGKVARELGENLMPSLDLNMNGVVGESLIRGFQPRTVAEALEQGKTSSLKDAMSFVVRPAVIAKDFKMEQNGHIGFLDASTGEVSQHSSTKGVGIRGPIQDDKSFEAARQPWAMVPPGWEKITGTPIETKQREKNTEQKINASEISKNNLQLNLTAKEKEEIGKRIWQNESGGKLEGLTAWNKGEEFPSLGIGHFLWQPKDSKSIFQDRFKDMFNYVKEHSNVEAPSWLKSGMPSPWKNKSQFENQFNGKEMTELRDYLSKTVAEQTDYLVQRLEKSFPNILDSGDASRHEEVRKNFSKVLHTGPAGVFALVDYVNFKGEGLKPEAGYKGQSWGLRQVLENMKDTGNPVADFSESAKSVLKNRVQNAPQERRAQEERWLLGWNNRIDGYQKIERQSEPAKSNLEVNQFSFHQSYRLPEQMKQGATKQGSTNETEKTEAKDTDARKTEQELAGKETEKQKETTAQNVHGEDLQFAIAARVLALANPKKGQGYYQPMQASGQELLGRDMSNAEVKAMVSAARALRQAQGKSLDSLSTKDNLLPASNSELKVFLDHIGSKKYGHQTLSAEQNQIFKDALMKAIAVGQKIPEGDSAPLPNFSKKQEPPSNPITPEKNENPEKSAPPSAPFADSAQRRNDIDTILAGAKVNGINIQNVRAQVIQRENNTGIDLPVVYSRNLTAGTVGVLVKKGDDGKLQSVPFVAGTPDKSMAKRNFVLDQRAAQSLGIDANAKGKYHDLSILQFAHGKHTHEPAPRSLQDLDQKLNAKASQLRAEKEQKQNAQKEVDQDIADAPKPDNAFGYRRSNRSETELKSISEHFRNLATESKLAASETGLEQRMSEAALEAKKDIQKYQSQIDLVGSWQSELNRLKAEEATAKQDFFGSIFTPERLPQLSAQRESAEQNYGAAIQSAKSAEYHLEYAKLMLKEAQDKNREIAGPPFSGPDIRLLTPFQIRMEKRAEAAAVLAANPDMKNALSGKRLVINEGHYPDANNSAEHSSGFQKHGINEWQLNHNSTKLLGEMVRLAGGAVRFVNQVDLKDKTISGLAGAIRVAKPDLAISIHHDNFEPHIDNGTLTLVCSNVTGPQSRRAAEVIQAAKANYTGIDSKPIREQCKRGVQKENVGAPFVLSEQLSTGSTDWARANDEREIAAMQFAHLAGITEYFGGKPRFKIDKQTGQAWRQNVWEHEQFTSLFSELK